MVYKLRVIYYLCLLSLLGILKLKLGDSSEVSYVKYFISKSSISQKKMFFKFKFVKIEVYFIYNISFRCIMLFFIIQTYYDSESAYNNKLMPCDIYHFLCFSQNLC